MAHVRLNQKKTVFIFVDEEGNQFYTSVNFLMGLTTGKSPMGFVQLKRMGGKVDMSRYKPSEMYVPPGVDPRTMENVDTTTVQGKKELQENKAFGSDDNVW